MTMEARKQIVDMIVSDISGRAGLGDEWNSIDEDIQLEIKQDWEKIINRSIESMCLRTCPI